MAHRYRRHTSNSEIIKTIQLLREGQNKTVLNEDIVVLLGTTGSGKSTLLQVIAGDNTKLRSVELEEETGEYIIVDDEKISNTTITSKTIFPELVFDSESKTNFYDCPGFSDTRSTSIDITATYLIKKLIDHAKRIKIVFAVSYPSVQKGVDRISFMELVKHATSLIKNINKYKDSIGIVVTKVNNEVFWHKNTAKLVSDTKIISKIGNFLAEVKNEQIDRIKKFDKTTPANLKTFHEQALHLINIMLLKEDDKYQRISIFRRPNEGGPVSNISLLQEGKAHIRNLLINSLKYTELNATDFGYTISDKSRNDIYDIAEFLGGEISTSLTSVVNTIKSSYLKSVSEAPSLEFLTGTLRENSIFLLKTVNQAVSMTNNNELLLLLINVLENLQLNVPQNYLSNIHDSSAYIDFLQAVSNHKLNSKVLEWRQAIQTIKENITEWQRWIEFLFSIYTSFSDYNIRNRVSQNNVAMKGVTNQNFQTFLKEFALATDKHYDSVKDTELDNLKVSMLNKVLDLTLKRKVESFCVGSNKLIVQGDFIKFSDVLKISCPGYEINHLEILASDTVYIDADYIRTGKKAHVTIIAPTWNVIGLKKIILDGEPGQPLYETKADDGKSVGENGKNGAPGGPGGPAGTFLGVGITYINGENLYIKSNGGKGGRGQNGGKGADGVNGKKIAKPSGKSFALCPDGKWEESTGTYQFINDEIELFVLFGGVVSLAYYGYGKGGAGGCDGGHGGRGGVGGNPGEIKLISLGKESNVHIQNEVGSRGDAGFGGEGGVGGWEVRTITLCKNKVALGVPWTEWYEDKVDWKYNQLRNGTQGDTGYNESGLIHSEKGLTLRDPSSSIKRYKEFMKKKLNDSINKKYLLEFLKTLESNSNVSQFYKTVEFIGLYEELKKTQQKFISPYNSFKEKIRESIQSGHARRKREINDKSSGYDTSSAINNGIHWLSSKWNLMMTNSGKQMNSISKLFITDGMSTASVAPDKTPESPVFSYNTTINQHQVNSTIMLADLLIRKLSKRKHDNKCRYNIGSMPLAQAHTLNIVADFKSELNELNKDNEYSMDEITFDPIVTQKNILKLIMNENFSQIPQTLYQSVSGDLSREQQIWLSNKIENILNMHLCKATM